MESELDRADAPVLSVKDKNPIVTALKTAMGETGLRLVIAIVTVSFISALLSLQAAASRLLFSFGRERMIAGYAFFGRGSGQVPIAALIACGIAPALFVLIGYVREDALTTIASFAVAGIYVAFQMIVGAALFARWHGWNASGAFRLGRLGWPVTVAALAYGITAIVCIAWPRSPEAPWYANYAALLSTVAVVASGLLYMAVGRPFRTNSIAAAPR